MTAADGVGFEKQRDRIGKGLAIERNRLAFHKAHGNRFGLLAIVEELRAIADTKGATVAQIAFAWVLSRGDEIVPLIGARRRDQLEEALAALSLELSAEELAKIEQAIPPGGAAGDRYGAPQMADLDSERA